MTEPEVLYNFGVLTKRYELVSRTASQLAPGIAGAAIGFVMILAGAPLPLPLAPVLVGFWFALGKVPIGQHRGVPVRAVVGPLARYGMLRLGGNARWVMPAMWLSVAVDPAATGTIDRAELAQSAPVVELGVGDGRHGVAVTVGRWASSYPPSWVGCAGRRSPMTGPKPGCSSSEPDARTC
jgi:hypothetical protein